MTAPMQTTQELVVDSLSPRMKQIIKAYNITTMQLNSVPVTVFQNKFHSDGRLIASNRLTMDSHYMVSGHDVQILPSALGLSAPFPAVVVFVAKEKNKEEYKNVKGLQVNKWERAIVTSKGEWSNGLFLVNGPLPCEFKYQENIDIDTTKLREDGEQFSIDFSTEYKQQGANTPNKKEGFISYYGVNGEWLVECRYIDFIVSNIRNDQDVTFHLIDGNMIAIRANGFFVGAVAGCRRSPGLPPEPHKIPKQSKTGILHARHETAEPVQVAESVQTEPVQTVETIEQPTENNQPETGDDMKAIVQTIIVSLVLWLEKLGNREKAVAMARQEIVATVDNWNDAFQHLNWHEWKTTCTAEQSQEIALAFRLEHGPIEPPPVETEPAPVAPALVEHTTRKGKVIRGIIRTDCTKEEAKRIDEYTFAKNGGWFIREKYLAELSPVDPAPENTPDTEPADVSPVTVAPVEIEPAGYRKGSTWYGGRYDSTLSTTDICKKIRQHLKDEAKKNPLFVFSRFSVRKDHHRSITIAVLEMGFNPLNPEYVQREKEGKYHHSEPYYTPDGKAFFDRIEELVESYNFDGSDLQSDYFHVNFYKNIRLDYEASKVFRAEIESDLENRVKEYRQSLRDSWPACTQCGEKTDRIHDTEDGEHTGLCWECFYPHYQAEQDAKKEAYRIEAEETARLIAQISDVELMPADEMIMICQPHLNKCCSIAEYNEQRDKGDCDEIQGKITHRAQLTDAQYDIFAENLLASLPWLAGKGGTDSTADLPGTDDLSFFQLTPEQQEEWKARAFSLFVEVTAPNRESIYIDPQGHSYARYVGFSAEPPAGDSPAAIDEATEPESDVIRFEVGKTYSTRSIGDHNCIYSVTIAKRTEKTVTTTEGKVYRPRVRTNHEGQTVETISAGNYSFAHSWDATDDKVLLRDWEQPAAIEKKKQAEQMDKAMVAVENLLAGVPIDEVMEQWERENGPIAEPVPAVTPSPAKASTDCAPVNRWNNQTPAGTTGPDAVKVAPVEKPVTSDNRRELWREQGARTEKRSKMPCVEILPTAHPNVPAAVQSCSTGHLAQRIEAKKETFTLAPVQATKQAKGARPVPVQDLPEKDEAFYPTPANLAHAMTMKIKGNPRTILDPSAGKGNLLDSVKDSYTHRSAALYAIEIDNNLRSILQGKGHKVIDSDFLAWSGPDKFDLILMNPPFNRGAEHLLKAIDTMYNGQIVCLLNAETLRNPCTNTRKELARRLEELGAEIEYKPRQFMQAERRTPVDVALINIIIERKVEDDLFEGANDTAEICSETIEDRHEVSTGKRIEELVARYNEVVRLTVETIVNFYRNHNTVGRYIGLNREPTGNWSPKKGYELTAKVQETVNSTVRTIRTDYWRMTLDLPEVKDRMTQKRRKEFEEKLRQNEHMDFTERNIRQFLINLIDGYTKTLEEGVLEVFDRLTIRNSYHEELHTKNIHYFNGWKTNNAYRVGQRVIVPVGGGYDGPFSSWGGKWKLDWTAARSLDDIDLVLSYFNGGREHVKLSDAIKAAFDRGEQSGRSTFFQFKAHKKGTLHLTFLDENILRRFNVAACRGKGWLPGDYGQKPFKDMTPAEKSTVQSFEAGGVEAYNANVGRALFDATINTIQLLEAA